MEYMAGHLCPSPLSMNKTKWVQRSLCTLGVVSKTSQGGWDMGRGEEFQELLENHSQLVKKLFPCELILFLKLLMETEFLTL